MATASHTRFGVLGWGRGHDLGHSPSPTSGVHSTLVCTLLLSSFWGERVVHIAPRDAPSRRASLVWGPVAVGVAVQGDVRSP